MEPSLSSRTGRIVVAFIAVLALLVVLSKSYGLWAAHEAAIAHAERDTASAASALAEHAARTFEGVSRALDAVRDLHNEVAAGTVVDRTVIHEALRNVQGTSPVILGIGWSDAGGERVFSSVSRDPPPLNIADQDHFTVHRERNDVGLYIGAAIRSRIDGTWIIPVSRRVDGPGGQFAGIINPVLRVDYFLDFYRAINLGPDTAVLLYRNDGVLLTRQPMKVEWMGRAIGQATVTRALASSGPAIAHRQSRIDGFTRIAADQAIRGFPLAITASMSEDDALARFRELRLTAIGEGALMILALIAGGILVFIAFRRRVAVTRALADTGAQLTSVFAATDQAICVFDRDLCAITWNDLCADLFPEAMKLGRGAALEDMLRATGTTGEYRVEDVEAFVARCMNIARSRQPAHYERVRPDGTVVDVGWLPLPNGCLAITHTDITRIKRAEMALRESEARAAQAHARLADAIESLTQPFMLWDSEERLVLFNRAAVDALSFEGQPDGGVLRPGITYEQMIRRYVAGGRMQSVAGREEAYFKERLEQFRRGTGERFEVQFANGRWYAIRDRRTEDGGTVSIRIDITETKRREAELSEARFAADAASRAKSDFLSRMSHELRTPLNAVIGFSQLLQLDKREPLSERQRLYCQDIETGGRHLLALVNDVLDLARIESGDDRLSVKRVAAAEALDSLRAAMAPIAESAGIALAVEEPAHLADIRVDDMRLHQILLNLVSNAIKYNRKSGSVLVAGDPNGVFVLLEGNDPDWGRRLRERWRRRHDLLLSRTIFLDSLGSDDFRAFAAAIDVGLDPIHFGGDETFYEAMLFGTPVITWPGEFMRGRVVAGAYRQMRIENPPVVARLGDYVPHALALGRDAERCRAIRADSMEAARRHLYDDRQAVRELETLLQAAVAAAGIGTRLPEGWIPPSASAS
jgi:signal transduction histidine kinase